MPKLSWELDLKGGETAAQKFRDLNKEVATLRGNLKSGISAADLFKASGGNFSQSFLKANPGLQQLLNAGKKEQQQASGVFGGFVTPKLKALFSAFGDDSGGLKNGILTTVGALAAFRVGLFAIQPVLDTFKALIKQISQSLHEGAKLYTDSAKLGQNPGKVSAIQFAANNLGISTEEAQQMMLAAQFPRAHRTGGNRMNGGGSIFGQGSVVVAGGEAFGSNRSIRMMGEQQKLNNLTREFVRELDDAGDASQRIGENAKWMFYTQYDINRLMLEWKAIWSDITVAIAPVIAGMATIATWSLKIWENFSQVATVLRIIGAINKAVAGPADFKQNPPGFGNMALNPNHFQHMGFMMRGGFNAEEHTKKIAKNSDKMVYLLGKLAGESVAATGNMLATSGMLP